MAPFPAGLNDCVSGVRWLAQQAENLGIDRKHIVVAGESGGGNLTLATGLKLKQSNDLGLIRGLYALCPYIAGSWPQDRYLRLGSQARAWVQLSTVKLGYEIWRKLNRFPPRPPNAPPAPPPDTIEVLTEARSGRWV